MKLESLKLKGSKKAEFIDLGYNSDVSLEFKVSSNNLSELKALVNIVESHNDFESNRVNEAIEKIFPLVSGFEFGREYSPVLYINIPYWTSQQNQNINRKNHKARQLTDIEKTEIINKVLTAFTEAKADENFYDKDLNKVRAWWD